MSEVMSKIASSGLLEVVLSVAAAVLTALAPLLVKAALDWFKSKAEAQGIEVNAKELELLRQLALEGVAYAAQGDKVARKKNGGEGLSPQEKKELALSFAAKLARKYEVSEAGISAIDGLIEAVLAVRSDL